MIGLISICIPTRRRSDLLKLAVQSCFRQQYRPLQILIGDDSEDTKSSETLREIPVPSGISVVYQLHTPSLGQSENLNWLIDHSAGDHIVILHDDDLLCDDALSILVEAKKQNSKAICVYGKQYIINDAGKILEKQTIQFNEFYDRKFSSSGRQPSKISAALLQQLPNNGYLLCRNIAEQVRFRLEREIGQSVDADFGIRLALASTEGEFIYVDRFVSSYRLTHNSILRSRINHGQHYLFDFVLGLDVPYGCLAAKTTCLKRLSAEAVLDAAMAKDRRRAWRILCSPYYRHRYLSKWTIFRIIYILSPTFGRGLDRLTNRARSKDRSTN